MSLLSLLEATFLPKLTQNQQTHASHSYDSFDPIHIKQSIIYSQFLRYKRICSNNELFLNDATKLFKYFLARQYPFYDILHNYDKVKQIDRLKLLSHTPKKQQKHYNTYVNVFTLVYLSVFELASIDLTLFRFTLTKGTRVPENYVFDLY